MKSNTNTEIYTAVRVIEIKILKQLNTLDADKIFKMQLRKQIAEALPNCNACVTYAYFIEAHNSVTDGRDRIESLDHLGPFHISTVIYSCYAQCITESEEPT